MIKITIVLGAGASVDYGYPLFHELTNAEALERRFTHVHENEKRGLIEYCADVLKDATNFEFFLKDLFLREQHYEFNKAIEYYSYALTVPELNLREGDLGSLSAYLLLFHLTAPVELHVLSFNHDILVERAAFYQFEYARGVSPLTYVPFEMGKSPKEAKAAVQHTLNGHPIAKLYKLHGSINQLVCKICGGTIYTHSPIIINHPIKSFDCPICHARGDNLSTNIIPPLSKKQGIFDFHGDVWKSARQILSESNIIEFVGYSMPAYDTDSLELFSHISPNAVVGVNDPYPTDQLRSNYRFIQERAREFNIRQTSLRQFVATEYNTRWGYRGNFREFSRGHIPVASMNPLLNLK